MVRRVLLFAFLIASMLLAGAALSCKNSIGVNTTTDTTNTSQTTTTTTLDVPPAYPQVPQITVAELKELMDEGAGVVIVDVRDPASYAYYHIPTAVNFFYDVNDDPMNMTMRLWSLPSNKLIVFYCN